MPIPLPNNLPLLISDPRSEANRAVAKIFQDSSMDTSEVLALLGRFWKIRAQFSEPVKIYGIQHWKKIDTITRQLCTDKTRIEHVFHGFFKQGGFLYYKVKQNGRMGYPFDLMDKLIQYEPIIKYNLNPEFESYEQFKAKFDPLFITETEIQKLWNSTSSQHGGKYTRKDFHKIGPVGKKVLKDFLVSFKGINTDNKQGYFKSPDVDYCTLKKHHYSYKSCGRDITISHQTNVNYVYYASEYAGCGNGRYGLLANKSEFLWLEDD